MTWKLDPDYKEPTQSNYLKFVEGENTFRILEGPITGWEYWVTDGDKRKPIRKHEGENIPVEEIEVDPKTGKPENPKYFWAMVVYNWEDDRVQILEITQTTIRRAILAMSKSKSWGDPTEYNIIVTKSGEGKETEYTVMPGQKEKLPKEIEDKYKAMSVNLEALFKGDDPFKNDDEIDIEEIAKEL